MPASAINKDSKPIFQGMAVAYNGSSVRLSAAGIPATHIATAAGNPGNVVSFTNTGELDLNDWSLAVGTKALVPNSTYYVSAAGKLTLTSTGQIAGFALSATTLKVLVPAPVKSQSATTTQTATVKGIPAGGIANQVLAKTSSSDYDVEWKNPSGGGGSLAALSDVQLTSLADGNVLTYVSADGKWENKVPSTGGLTYALSDYDIGVGTTYSGEVSTTTTDWIIYKMDTVAFTQKKATGTTGYATNWTNRLALTYV